jgi:hypothetical protein
MAKVSLMSISPVSDVLFSVCTLRTYCEIVESQNQDCRAMPEDIPTAIFTGRLVVEVGAS